MDSIEQASAQRQRVEDAKAAAQTGPLRIGLVADSSQLSPSLLDDQLFQRLLVPESFAALGQPGLIASEGAALAAVQALTDRVGSHALLVDLAIDHVAADGDIVRQRPDLFELRARSEALDPRHPLRLDLGRPTAADEAGAARLGAWWGGLIAAWTRAGLGGVVLRGLSGIRPSLLPALIHGLRHAAADSLLIADTASTDWGALAALQGAGLDGVLCSLAWWNWSDRWLGDELALLRRVAPVLAQLDPRRMGQRQVEAPQAAGRALAWCAAHGLGWITPPGAAASEAAWLAGRLSTLPFPRILSAPDSPVQAVLRGETFDPRWTTRAAILLLNTLEEREARLDPQDVLPAVGGRFHAFAEIPRPGAGRTVSDARPGAGQKAGPDDKPESRTILVPGTPVRLQQAAWRLFESASLPHPERPPLDQSSAIVAASLPRLAIEAPEPAVDGGLFPVKRTVGELVIVEVDVIGDGHDMLAAALQWRGPAEPGATEAVAADEGWQETRMRLLGNDRWTANFPLLSCGLHQYRIEAWRDQYASYRHELGAKSAAGVPISLELIEGEQMLQAAVRRGAEGAAAIGAVIERLPRLAEPERVALMLSAEVKALMERADDRPHNSLSASIPVEAERTAAGFASWYEVFPRSMSDDPDRHGTFADVERHLPRIRGMGFDVLYFPPIHPIGRTNRKGRNNTLTPGPEDVGSPYAIGNEDGGHDAIHPQLGTLADFLHMREAAEAHGLEIAIDFAIQCAPDHPWLREHRDWFSWRPDGSMRYAENPPKKYQDIVNVDFYAPGSVPELWLALANVVLFWAENGIRLFRVDNPHTKPLPFWQWLISEVRARYPDAAFLAEAFTRPKVMNRLAKVGFNQSYTYFTWRNSKAEISEYLTQLSREAPRDFFRPHFFVNTPDINPVFLQTSGRPGFLIRAALAATLSGLWGVYSGFELCEGTPLPGREEYLDSEKYQIRAWDWNRPGNIVPEVTRLNQIRAENPALRSHRSVSFLPSSSDAVLFYEKATPERDNCLLCLVNLDPFNPQSTQIELPLWKWGMPDQATLQLEDLIGGDRFQLAGKYHTVTLNPAQPYYIWRVRPPL